MSQNDFLRATGQVGAFLEIIVRFLCLRGPGQAKKMKGKQPIN